MSSKITVLGLGYIGLPTAAMFAKAGHQVLGVDANSDVIATLKNNDIHIEEPGLKDVVAKAVSSGRLEFGNQPDCANVFVIAVPTPITVDKTADLTYVISAAKSIVPHLRPGNLVILESTVPPGTVCDVVAPIVETSGLTVGEELHVVHCPERVIPGKIMVELEQNSRIVGGVTPKCADMAATLYRSFVQGDVMITDATTAEMVKLMENTFRDVNIALANEFAKISTQLGVDVWGAIDLANRHPRVSLLRPGPGVGGHCIAVDPWFIVERSRGEAELISKARHINDTMPDFVIEQVMSLVKHVSHPHVACLGMAFKGDVDDMRESPTRYISAGLYERGIDVTVYDPLVKADYEYKVESLESAVAGTDVVLILTDHKIFGTIDPLNIVPRVRTPILMDTRHCVAHDRWLAAGFRVWTLGDGRSQSPLSADGQDSSPVFLGLKS